MTDAATLVKSLRERIDRVHAPSSLVPVYRHELEALLDHLEEVEMDLGESVDVSAILYGGIPPRRDPP